MRTTVLSLFSMLTLVIAVRAQKPENQYEQRVLSLPLFSGPIIRNNIALTQALGVVGAYVQDGYVLFGLELHSKNGQEPVVTVDLPPDSHFEDALRQIMSQIPGYEYEVISEHMVDIHPTGAKRHPADLLNTPVPKFDAVDVDPTRLLTSPADFISELAARLRPKTSAGPQPSGAGGSVLRGLNVPTITLHMKDTTVRGILNAASEAMEQFPPDRQPVGWTYLFQPDPASPIGGKHFWAFLFSAPRNWKQNAAKSGQYCPARGMHGACFAQGRLETALAGSLTPLE